MIAKKEFGRTGHLSTRIIFGAAAFGNVTQLEADRTLDVLLEYGVNHIDTAASYGDSELRIGPWMAEHRKDFFLATKTGKRTYKEARDEFHHSLERLQVDSVDLLQLHYLVGEEEWEIAMGPGGALEMAIEAREQGLVKFIGVTGHDVAIAGMHQRSLERFDFDSVLLPYSYIMMQNPEYAEGFESVMAICKGRNTAVQTIKSLVRRPWQNGQSHTFATWYEPLSDQNAIDRAVHWVLGNEDVFLNSAGDIHLLPKILDAANRFEGRPTDGEMQASINLLSMQPLFT
jgi:aryl-alcohol dehydrogenase-like predicted oxidoreductase